MISKLLKLLTGLHLTWLALMGLSFATAMFFTNYAPDFMASLFFGCILAAFPVVVTTAIGLGISIKQKKLASIICNALSFAASLTISILAWITFEQLKGM